jgi:GH15 family glucan-1,4-alpha-glucosidase
MSPWTPARTDGWTPLEQYAVIGDGRTVALVAADGRIDWLALPALHAPPVFAAVLDPADGGYLELRPAGEFTVSRRYVGDSQVLETTFHAAQGRVRVTDALTVSRTGPLPWTELGRRIEGLEGAVPMIWSVCPGTRFGTAQPWTQQQAGVVLAHCGDQHLALRASGIGDPDVGLRTVSGTFVTAAGSRHLLALSGADDAPICLPDPVHIDARIDATVRHWQAWSEAIVYDGRWPGAVRRSALALKLLTYEPTGAIAAAATTSLPERIGGDKNWDYRYL